MKIGRLYTSLQAPLAAASENRKIFGIYNLYRLVLALVLLVSFYFRPVTSPLGLIDQDLFAQLCIIYALGNALSLLLPLLRQPEPMAAATYSGTIILDILILVAISYTCGGVSSGMAHLLIVPVATGSMLFGIRISTFFAAIGSIAAILAEVYLYLTVFAGENYYVQAGLLGLTLFATSLSLQYLGGRIRQKDLINRMQASNIQSLQEMNQQIIQRMQAGIIVVTPEGAILNCNNSARALLQTDEAAELQALPSILLTQLQQWQADQSLRAKPFRTVAGGEEIQASFTWLQSEQAARILIFLEDHSQLRSRAQHLKLVALGRLTASIAHEIRNPLGAISHASQLLEESAMAATEDKRLINIIHTHSQRVSTIIQNILELSRQRREAAEQLALKPWLEAFLERFSSSYRDPVLYRLEVLPPDIVVRFSPSQLDQLLTNLCDNAIRYSRQQHGILQVTVLASLHPLSNCPVLDVIDEGPGVPEAMQEQIFEPFFTTENSGTGLGLFICREICEASQAQIIHRRTESGHSSFRIIFAHPDRLMI
jgi:two-component system, NtrC family, sensor histidine kinase PilS